MKYSKKIIRISVISISLILIFFSSIFCIHYYRRIDGIPIVGYHGVCSDEEKESLYKFNPYYMSVSEFKNQMKYLHEHDYETLFINDVYDYFQGNRTVSKKTICITFDDGYTNFNTIVKDILKEYNLKATCFVIGNKTTKGNKKYLQQKDLINDSNVQYYSHSYDLHHLGKKKNQKLIETLTVQQIAADFKKNEGLVSSEYFAFPYGRSCDNANAYLQDSSVKLAFSYNQFRHMTREDNQYYLPRYLMFSHMPQFLYKLYIK